MKLYDNWQSIITKAWSVRLMSLTVVLQVIDAALPVLATVLPHGAVSALTAISAIGAIVARVVPQSDL